METRIKNLDKAKQKLGDEKNELTQNAKELESEKVKLAQENENRIKELETGTEKLNSENQVLRTQLLEKDLELTKRNSENVKGRKNDSGFCSGINTLTTLKGSLPTGPTLDGAVKRLESYKKNQEMQTEATLEGQSQKRRLIRVDKGLMLTKAELDIFSRRP